jgi:hypothetical protein
MVQRLDYFALLSRAVEPLERDAYAARGAVYDREHKALLKRLISSSSPCTDADIVREEQAFRDAVRRIEFPEDVMPAPRTPQREDTGSKESWPNSSREKARRQRREAPQEPANDAERAPPREARRRFDAAYEETGKGPPGRPSEAPPGRPSEPAGNGTRRRSRSLLRLTAGYLLVAALVLGAGSLGYAFVVGALDIAWLTQWSGQASLPAPRAILYEGGQSSGPRKAVEGKATWRTRTEPTGPSGKPDTVVTVEAEIPEQHIALTLSISRVADADTGMSHLLEIRFVRPQELPFGGISTVSNVIMKATETDPGESLVGTSINIAPGQFMFGLLAVPDVAQKNIQRLRTQSWLSLALSFAKGTPYTLAIEKGPSGERAINDALAKWGQ